MLRVKKILKWLLFGLSGVVGVALLGVATIYLLIGSDLARTFDVVGAKVTVPTDEASIAEGKRLARLRGCYNGCHGKTTTGRIMFDMPDGTRVFAPDLGRAAQTYSIQELDRLIRHGIRPDGTSLILGMPSDMFHHLSDEDFAAIIAFLRSQAPGDVRHPDPRIGPLARLFLFQYKQIFGTILAAEMIDHDMPRIVPAKDDVTTYGRYLALTVCTECHGADLRGMPNDFAPSLALVSAYSVEDFRKLMRTGEPIGGRQLELMARVAVSRFSHLTDREISSLHAYLQTLAGTDSGK